MENHSHQDDLKKSSKPRLLIVFLITSGFFIVEVITGLVSNSLALLADAGHMLNDMASILLALVAIYIGSRKSRSEFTFGYQRAEVLSGLINGISLLFVGGYIIFAAYERIDDLEAVSINGSLVILVSIIGLGINVLSLYILKNNRQESVNIEGAFHHILADVFGSIAALIAGLGVLLFNSNIPDIIASVVVSVLVLRSGVLITVKTGKILLQASPDNTDINEVKSQLKAIDGVTEVCDFHCWTVTNGFNVITAHLIIDAALKANEIVKQATKLTKGLGFNHGDFSDRI